MILPNVRSRLGPADLRFVIVALARHDARTAARQRRPLLDDPALLEALLAVRSLVQPSAPLFAYVAVRHVLRAAARLRRPRCQRPARRP